MFILSELKNKTFSSISFKKEEIVMEEKGGKGFIIRRHPKLKDTVKVSLSRVDGNIADILDAPILEAFYYYDYKDVFYDIGGEEANYFALVTFVFKSFFGEVRFIWIATSDEIILETHSLLSLGIIK
jgi:hypothetical protein